MYKIIRNYSANKDKKKIPIKTTASKNSYKQQDINKLLSFTDS